MEIEYCETLSDSLEAEWGRFLDRATHQHARQDIRFGLTDLAEGHEIRYVIGREGHMTKAVGMFVFVHHPILPGAFSSAYCLSGPISDDPEVMMRFLDEICRSDAFAKVGRISITPYWLDNQGRNLGATLRNRDWSLSETEDARQTGIVNISGTATDIASRFSQSCRRKLRKAEKQDLSVTALHEEAGAKDFLARLNRHRTERGLRALNPKSFIAAFKHVYRQDDLGTILVIYHQGRFVAGIVLHRSRDTTHFIYSVHDDVILADLENLRISPFLMLEAMKWANARGCHLFDLEGYRDPNDPTNPLQHIHKYKSEFKPQVTFRVAEHHRIINRAVYFTGEPRKILKRTIKSLLR